MRFACRITKATDTHSKYVIFVTFRGQQWIRESAALLRYLCIVTTIELIVLWNTTPYALVEPHLHFPIFRADQPQVKSLSKK